MEGWGLYPFSLYQCNCDFSISDFLRKYVLYCTERVFKFIFGDKYSSYLCGASKGSNVIWWYSIKEAVTRVRTVKVTLYAHENLTFLLTKNRLVNIQTISKFKTNEKIKYMVGNIINAKIKMRAERDLLLLIILRMRRREKENSQV